MITDGTNLFAKLWQYLSPKRKRQFFLVLMLMIIVTFIEMLRLGAVLPFIGVLISPKKVYEHELVGPIIEFLGITTPEQLLLPFTIIFIFVIVVSAAVRLLFMYTSMRFAYAIAADLSIDIYRRSLYQSYATHTARNSSVVISGISKSGAILHTMLTPTMTLLSNSLLLIGIVPLLLLIDAVVATSIFVGFGTLYAIIIFTTKKYVKNNSICIATKSTQLQKFLQEGLGGIRDVLLDNKQEFYCHLYRQAHTSIRRALGNNDFIGASPYNVIEALTITIIAYIAYTMSQTNDLTDSIPILGVLVFGIQRFSPALNQIYHAFSSIIGGRQSCVDAFYLLDQKLPDHANQSIFKPLVFCQNITLKNVGFRYSHDDAFIFKDINFVIPKGSRIGFIGETGNGKTTLLDVIMGLLTPTHGHLLIDGKEIKPSNYHHWQAHISHVPQNIYLSDASIAENIAFGMPQEKIDHDLLQQTSRQAQLHNLIQQWPDKYDTRVGERGIQLSGGQRQRIGIARALYKKANVLILDEATSALDTNTESKVMAAIGALDDQLTILIIAHRLTTLKNCDQIIEVSSDGLRDVEKSKLPM